MPDFQSSSAPVYLSLFLPPLPEQKEPQEYPMQYSRGSLGFSLFLLLPLLLCTGQRGGDGVRHHIESEKSFHIMADSPRPIKALSRSFLPLPHHQACTCDTCEHDAKEVDQAGSRAAGVRKHNACIICNFQLPDILYLADAIAGVR